VTSSTRPCAFEAAPNASVVTSATVRLEVAAGAHAANAITNNTHIHLFMLASWHAV
jgi:hypothetical protein